MATLTRNLKLRLSTDLSSDARYNLERIDLLAAAINVDTNGNSIIRSAGDIQFRPEDNSVGGSGTGGNIAFGDSSQATALVTVYGPLTVTGLVTATTFSGNATHATTTAGLDNNILTGDVSNSLNNITVVSVGGKLAAAIATSVNDTLAATSSSTASTIVKRDASGNLKAGTITASLSGTATSALNLSGSNLTGDVTNTNNATTVVSVGGKLAAAIATSVNDTLAATNSNTASTIVKRDASGNFSAGTITANLTGNASTASLATNATTAANLSGSNLTGDVTNVANATTVVSVGGELAADVATSVQDTQAATDSNTASTIVKRDASGNFSAGTVTATLNGLSSNVQAGAITDNEVSNSAAIAGSKISSVFGNQLVSSEQGYDIVGGTYTASIRQAGSPLANVTFKLPPTNGALNAVLITDGAGQTSWSTLTGTGTVTSVDMTVPSILTISGNPITTAGTLALGLATQAANLVLAGPATGAAATPTFRQLSTSEITEGTNLYHTTLRAQDAVGAIVADTATAEVDYVTGTSLSVTVTPDGFINTTGGLLDTLGILSVDPTKATAKTGVIGADVLLIADSADSNNLKKILVSDILTLAGNGYSTTWTSGTAKTVTHSLNSRNVLVEIYDNTTYETVYVDSVVRTDVNTVTLTASEAPAGAGLTVLVKRIR